MQGHALNDEINLTETLMDIKERVSVIQTDIAHLTERITSKSQEIRDLEHRITVLEHAHDSSKALWFDYIIKGLVTIILGFVAVKVGLK